MTRHEALDARRYLLRVTYEDLAGRVGLSLSAVWTVLRGAESLIPMNRTRILNRIERALDEIEAQT